MIIRGIKRHFLIVIPLLFVTTLFAPSVKPYAISSSHDSCYAICGHESHGSQGWYGPIRTGSNADAQATADAEAHNRANPGHKAQSSCY